MDLTLRALLETKALIDSIDPPRFDTLFGSDAMLRKQSREVLGIMANPDVPTPPLTRIAGFDVHVLPANLVPRRPVLQISPEFGHCSPEFRAAWNAWALERFGTEEICYLANSRALAAILRADFNRMEREFICNGVVEMRNHT